MDVLWVSAAVQLTPAIPADWEAVVRELAARRDHYTEEARLAGDRRDWDSTNELDGRGYALAEAIRIVLGTRGT